MNHMSMWWSLQHFFAWKMMISVHTQPFVCVRLSCQLLWCGLQDLCGQFWCSRAELLKGRIAQILQQRFEFFICAHCCDDETCVIVSFCDFVDWMTWHILLSVRDCDCCPNLHWGINACHEFLFHWCCDSTSAWLHVFIFVQKFVWNFHQICHWFVLFLFKMEQCLVQKDPMSLQKQTPMSLRGAKDRQKKQTFTDKIQPKRPDWPASPNADTATAKNDSWSVPSWEWELILFENHFKNEICLMTTTIWMRQQMHLKSGEIVEQCEERIVTNDRMFPSSKPTMFTNLG